MQALPIEFILEVSAIFAGVLFALVALIGIYHYSRDIQYRRWAFTHLLFWVAFIPENSLSPFPYLGFLGSMILRVLASLLLLKAYNFRRLSTVRNSILYLSVLIGSIAFIALLMFFALSPTTVATPTSIIMTYSFTYVSHRILKNGRERSTFRSLAGVSYGIWALASLPMSLLPLIPAVFLVGYIQFIAQSLVMITMFLAFIGSTNQRIEDNLRMTSLYASLVSHDLRNFVNVASGAIELVKGKEGEDQQFLDTARKTLKSASTFLRKIRGLWLDITMQSESIVDLDLREILDEVLERARGEHSLSEEEIRLSCPLKCYVSTTPLIEQVVWNLVDNAIRYSKGLPKVKVSVMEGSDIAVSIQDTAGGLSKYQKERLLKKNDDVSSLGIGLMLVREITQNYGIQLTLKEVVEDDKVVGTIFTLHLPHSGGVPP